MFQFLRRVSGSLLPRPDRPWRDDATSHAPTIGRKRAYSVTDQDVNDYPSSTAKRMKTDRLEPDTQCDAAAEEESTKLPSVERQDVKEVTKRVNEVDLEATDKAEDPSVIQPETIPLPDSPSGSPEPESESPELAGSDVLEETEEHADGEDSVASSSPDGAEEQTEDNSRTEPESATANLADGTALAQEVTDTITPVEPGVHDTPDILEIKE